MFGLALGLRLLFTLATPDATWPYSAAFKGDALVWLDYARALQQGRPFDLGLPIHPPGNAHLIALVWNGQPSGVRAVRLLWVLMGALTAALVHAAARRSFGPRPALVAGVATAVGTGPLVLSASLNNETPYLLLVAASLLLTEDLQRRPRALALGAWALLQSLGCLFRVEHALFAAPALGWLAWRWRAGEEGAPWRSIAGRAALVTGLAALALGPWHAHAWRAVARFNTQPPALSPAEQAARRPVETRLAHLRWTDGARRLRDELPAFARDTAAVFVAATVAHRGRSEVRAEDFAVLDEAFGSRPRPLARFPFVSIYGPLNFALANHAGAGGGFSPALLEEPPPLAARPAAFPPDLAAGLPPPQLSFLYPPHLALVNDGYALGTRWIVAHPLDFLALEARKLRLFWSGAALGVGGYNLPLGASGLRRQVDLVTPADGALVTLWQLALLGLTLAGTRAALRAPAAHPWLLFLLSKVAVTLAFFGYARQGAAVVPMLALLAALALGRAAPSRGGDRRFGRGVLVIAVLLFGLEAARFLRPPQVRLDGLPMRAADPIPADVHRTVVYEAR